MAAQRRARDERRAARAAVADDDGLLNELTTDGAAQNSTTDVDILTQLGISRELRRLPCKLTVSNGARGGLPRFF